MGRELSDGTVQSENRRCEVCKHIYGYGNVRKPARKSSQVLTAGLFEIFDYVSDESGNGRDSIVCVFWVRAANAQQRGDGREDQLVREGSL
jgi:hypothetical protein